MCLRCSFYVLMYVRVQCGSTSNNIHISIFQRRAPKKIKSRLRLSALIPFTFGGIRARRRPTLALRTTTTIERRRNTCNRKRSQRESRRSLMSLQVRLRRRRARKRTSRLPMSMSSFQILPPLFCFDVPTHSHPPEGLLQTSA